VFKQFLKDGATYGIATILTRGMSLLAVPIYTRVISPSDYGALDLLTVLGTLVNLTIALEVSQGLARFYGSAPNATERRAYASTALWFTLATYTVALSISLVVADELAPHITGSSGGSEVLRIAFLAFWASGIFYLVQSQLRWDLRARAYATVSVVATVLGIAVSVVLVAIARLGLVGILIGQLVASGIGAMLGLLIARESYRPTFDTSKLRAMLSFSLPLVPSGMGVFVTMYADRIFIVTIMSIADVGIYGLGYRLASLTSLLTLAAQGAITPLVYSRHEEPEAPVELARIFRYFVALALLACLTLSLFSAELIAILAPPNYGGAASVVPLLAPAMVLAGMYVFAPGLALGRRSGVIAAINLGGAAGIAAMNLLLVPVLGIVGAAAANLFGSALLFVAYVVCGQRVYPIPYPWRTVLLGACLTSAGWLLGANMHIDRPLEWIARGAIIVAVGASFPLIGLVGPSTGVWRAVAFRGTDRKPS